MICHCCMPQFWEGVKWNASWKLARLCDRKAWEGWTWAEEAWTKGRIRPKRGGDGGVVEMVGGGGDGDANPVSLPKSGSLAGSSWTDLRSSIANHRAWHGIREHLFPYHNETPVAVVAPWDIEVAISSLHVASSRLKALEITSGLSITGIIFLRPTAGL